jgi:hypothetical protein
MAVVQIFWRDNSDNETSFKIYKGTSSPLSASSDQIATVSLVSGAWEVAEAGTGTAPDVTLTSTNTGNSTTQNETFVITYTEGTPNNYYYGVSAANAIGDSDVVTTPSALAVS